MATFDPQAILDAVDTGAIPDTWKVYRAKKSYLLGQGLFICILGLLMLFCSGLLIAIGVFIIVLPGRDGGALIGGLAAALGGLVSVALSAGFLWAGVSLWWQMRTAAIQILALTPDGFVARTAVQPKIPLTTDSPMTPASMGWTGTSNMRIYVVAYSQARTVSLVVRHTRAESQISLDFALKTPNPYYIVRWFVDPRFGKSDTVAQQIIEAHARYAAQ